eukprot:CAMPEP_0170596842 /NCGR_PEP_ID=MMETSP0224-20130122/15358_1 /TAXON_ID=285029 /ORGANISM="Togula jolla, Strain CCCM 725" /LENGTH=57 /DNA_ID=CAMNT_0010921211 /DNA_START=232 /DNA_END=405 /DNA_ORIENTATION=-
MAGGRTRFAWLRVCIQLSWVAHLESRHQSRAWTWRATAPHVLEGSHMLNFLAVTRPP